MAPKIFFSELLLYYWKCLKFKLARNSSDNGAIFSSCPSKSSAAGTQASSSTGIFTVLSAYSKRPSEQLVVLLSICNDWKKVLNKLTATVSLLRAKSHWGLHPALLYGHKQDLAVRCFPQRGKRDGAGTRYAAFLSGSLSLPVKALCLLSITSDDCLLLMSLISQVIKPPLS